MKKEIEQRDRAALKLILKAYEKHGTNNLEVFMSLFNLRDGINVPRLVQVVENFPLTGDEKRALAVLEDLKGKPIELSEAEWNKFYNFSLEAMQYYLRNPFPPGNVP